MITLALDASTYSGDVALVKDNEVVAEEAIAMRDAEHERLMPAVAAVLDRAGLRVAEVDRIVCGAGPGSFTSLRIAGSIAKGLAAGASKPLFAVPSMALMLGGELADGRYLTAIDALRGEWYVGLYELAAGAIEQVEPPRLVPAEALMALAGDHDARLLSASPVEGALVARPMARSVAKLGKMLNETGPADPRTWEPAYGRLAEAQVKWETLHGRPLSTG